MRCKRFTARETEIPLVRQDPPRTASRATAPVHGTAARGPSQLGSTCPKGRAPCPQALRSTPFFKPEDTSQHMQPSPRCIGWQHLEYFNDPKFPKKLNEKKACNAPPRRHAPLHPVSSMTFIFPFGFFHLARFSLPLTSSATFFCPVKEPTERRVVQCLSYGFPRTKLFLASHCCIP